MLTLGGFKAASLLEAESLGIQRVVVHEIHLTLIFCHMFMIDEYLKRKN